MNKKISITVACLTIIFFTMPTFADVQVSEAGILLGKIEGKPGRNAAGEPLWQAVPIVGRNYITAEELATTYSYRQDHYIAVPYIVATGSGKVTVAVWKDGQSGRQNLNTMAIDVPQTNAPKQFVVNVLYGIPPLRQLGNYGMTFTNNGSTIHEASFSIGEPLAGNSAQNVQASEQFAACRTCGGTGVAENTSGKLGPNGQMIVTKREQVRCWTCGGAGKIRIN